MKIYLIDDDDLSNFVSAKTIEKSGIAEEIIQFSEAKVALEHLKLAFNMNPKDLPDVMFLDINMPEMNGWDFLNEFCKLKDQNNKKIRIFLLTSSVYQQDIEKSKLYPEVVDYIPKPITLMLLKEIRNKYFVKI